MLSVNSGRGQSASWAGRIGRTAIDKRPSAGPVALQWLGAAGDEQVDTDHHGGPDQALYAYAREDLDWWVEQLGRELGNGVFGENVTTAGLDISAALIGETWQLGTAVVQVTSVRVPCATFAGWLGERQWVRRFASAGRPGAYLRVLAEGQAGPGDPIEVIARPSEQVTVAEALRAHYGDEDAARRLLLVPGRSRQFDEQASSLPGPAAR